MEAAATAVLAATKLKRAGGSEAVRVVVRCRPLSSKEVRGALGGPPRAGWTHDDGDRGAAR